MASYDPQRGSWYTDDGTSVSLSAGSIASRSSSVRTTSGTYKEIDLSRLGRRSRRGSRVIEFDIEGPAALPHNYSTSAEYGSSPPRTTRSPAGPSKKKKEKKKEKQGFFDKIMPTRKKLPRSHKKQSSVESINMAFVDRRDSLEDRRSPATSSGKGKERAHRNSFALHPTPTSSANGEDTQTPPYRTEIREPSWVSQARDDQTTILEDARGRYLDAKHAYETAYGVTSEEAEQRLFNDYTTTRRDYFRLQREHTNQPFHPQQPRSTAAYHGLSGRTFASRVQDPTPGPAAQKQRVPPAAPLNATGGTGLPSLQQSAFPPNHHPRQDWSYPAGPAHQSAPPPAHTAPTSPRRQDGRYTFNPGEIVRENLRPPPQSASTAPPPPPPSSSTPASFTTVRENLPRRAPSTSTSPTSPQQPPSSRSRVSSRGASPASARQTSPLEPIAESDEERVSRMVREERARRREEGGGRGMSYDA